MFEDIDFRCDSSYPVHIKCSYDFETQNFKKIRVNNYDLGHYNMSFDNMICRTEAHECCKLMVRPQTKKKLNYSIFVNVYPTHRYLFTHVAALIVYITAKKYGIECNISFQKTMGKTGKYTFNGRIMIQCASKIDQGIFEFYFSDYIYG